MTEPGAGTQLTLLDTTEAIPEVRLADLYAYPADLTRCTVRSNFISSLDGGATADGKSGGLAGPGDKALFQLMRELADVIMVGAGTVRVENYGAAQMSAAARQQRADRGQSEVPPIAIVTQHGRLEPDMKVFTASEMRPLILTCTAAGAETADRLSSVADVLVCSDTNPNEVDMATVLTMLAERGLTRVLTEGGPRLHGTLIEAGLLDELCVSVAPVLVGGQARRIATGLGQVLTKMHRAHLLADDAGYLYMRYVRE